MGQPSKIYSLFCKNSQKKFCILLIIVSTALLLFSRIVKIPNPNVVLNDFIRGGHVDDISLSKYSLYRMADKLPLNIQQSTIHLEKHGTGDSPPKSVEPPVNTTGIEDHHTRTFLTTRSSILTNLAILLHSFVTLSAQWCLILFT